MKPEMTGRPYRCLYLLPVSLFYYFLMEWKVTVAVEMEATNAYHALLLHLVSLSSLSFYSVLLR